MTRAAKAAQHNRANSLQVPDDAEDEVVVAVPGEEGVPVLPKGANGSFKSVVDSGAEVEVVKATGRGRGRPKKVSEGFEWPDDVF